jgi:hypothetical protein
MNDPRPPREPRGAAARAAGVAGLVLLAVALLAGGWLWFTGNQIAAALDDARATLHEVESPDELTDAAALVEEDVARAVAATDRLVWRLSRSVPVIQRSVRIVDDVVELAEASASLAVEVAPLALQATEGMGAAESGIDGEVLRGVADDLAALDLTPIGQAHERLAERSTEGTLRRVREGRAEALEAGSEVLTMAGSARAGTAALVDVLGLDGPRRYLLAIQNPAELRGTGGLIGQVAVLESDEGSLALDDVRSYTDLVDDDPPWPEHLDAPADFVERYGHVEADTFLGNTNVDPDLPTVAPVVLGIYRAHTDELLDGVVMVDPLALELLLRATGPVEVPGDAGEGLAERVEADEVAWLAMVEAYVQLGGDDPARQEFLSALAGRVFEELTTVDPTSPEVVADLTRALRSRHVQVFSRDEQTQQALEELGFAGRLPHADETDLLAVTANNAGGNKQDVHVGHGLEVDIELEEPEADGDGWRGTRRTAHRISVGNPLVDDAYPPYIIGPPDAVWGAAEPDATNTTWFTVWGAEGSELLGASRDGEQARVASGSIGGRTGFDHHLVTPPESTASVTMVTRSPVAYEEEDGVLTYELTVWRQPKGIADELDLRVLPPPGYEVVDVALDAPLEAGPLLEWPGAVLGIDELPEVAARPDVVVVRGALTEDLRLTVQLAR